MFFIKKHAFFISNSMCTLSHLTNAAKKDWKLSQTITTQSTGYKNKPSSSHPHHKTNRVSYAWKQNLEKDTE